MCTFLEWQAMNLLEKTICLLLGFVLSVLFSLPGWLWIEFLTLSIR